MSKRRPSQNLPQQRKRDAGAEASTGLQKYNPLREAHTRAEREAIIQRLVLLGTAIAGGLVVVIVILALAWTLLIAPGRAVAVVNGDTITVSEFRERVRLERALINNRLNALFAEALEVGANDQFFQFRLSQEPYLSLLEDIDVNGYVNNQVINDILGNRVLNDMIEDQLVRDEAAARGITVSEEDIQAEINAFFEYDPDAFVTEADGEAGDEEAAEAVATEEMTPTPTPFVSPTPSPEPSPTATATPTEAPTEEAVATEAATPEVTPTIFPTLTPFPTVGPTEAAANFQSEVDASFAEIRRTAGVNQAAIDRYFETQALRTALREAVGMEIDATEPHVYLRHILVETEEEAQDVLAALEAGESFAALAQVVSLDPGSADNGGEYAWAPASQYVEPFADAAREGEIGAFQGPVATDFGFHIIQVRDRRQEPMNEAQLELARQEAFDEFITELRQAPETEVETFAIWTDNVPGEPIFIPTN